MSNLGKWNEWYQGLESPEAYGDTATYALGADFLKDCKEIEDWGCGKGWFRAFVPESIKYTGVDGSENKFVDKVVDLEKYTSKVEGIYMRHVLEHNYEWKKVLQNAVDSFTKKMVLVVFTPFSEGKTEQIDFIHSVGVPDMSFSQEELEEVLGDNKFTIETIESGGTAYRVEHLYLIEK